MRIGSSAICTVLLAAAAISPLAAQDFPRKQIELVVPFVAGGTTDTIARLIAQRFSDSWGQTVVVSNRPGGGSTIGHAVVARSPADGHTLLVSTISFAITAALQKLPFDPIKDFAPITELASLPLMLVVHPSLPATNLEEFIAHAKAKPGAWDFASSGVGTSPHLAAEMFKSMAGIDLVHVPYKGNAEAMNAFLGGHIKIYFALVPAVIQHVRAGTLRASPSPPRSACPICRPCRPSPSPAFPVTRSIPGRACSRRRGHRRTSSARSTASWSGWSTRPRSAPGWSWKARLRWEARPTPSPRASRMRSPSGAR